MMFAKGSQVVFSPKFRVKPCGKRFSLVNYKPVNMRFVVCKSFETPFFFQIVPTLALINKFKLIFIYGVWNNYIFFGPMQNGQMKHWDRQLLEFLGCRRIFFPPSIKPSFVHVCNWIIKRNRRAMLVMLYISQMKFFY